MLFIIQEKEKKCQSVFVVFRILFLFSAKTKRRSDCKEVKFVYLTIKYSAAFGEILGIALRKGLKIWYIE